MRDREKRKQYKRPNTAQRMALRGEGIDPDEWDIAREDFESLKIVNRKDGRIWTIRW